MVSNWDDDYAELAESVGGLRDSARRIHQDQVSRLGRRPKPRRPDPGASDLDKAIAIAVELRGLISDAHGGTKDLRSAVAEYRQLLADADKTVDAAMERAANRVVEQWANYMQAEQNRHAASLNDAVQEAQDQILRSLTVAELKFSREDDSMIHFKFTGPARPFNDQVPEPHPGAGLPEGKI